IYEAKKDDIAKNILRVKLRQFLNSGKYSDKNTEAIIKEQLKKLDETIDKKPTDPIPAPTLS
ncbi:MAG: hypothetical protein V1647_04945, partial [Pseudomonadota bacterium]